MRQAIWGLVVGVSLVAVLTVWPADAEPINVNTGLTQGGLITYVQKFETHPTSVIIIDPQQRTMAVYHIGLEQGHIEFKSARKFEWDLGMTEHNSNEPLPLKIRSGLRRQQ